MVVIVCAGASPLGTLTAVQWAAHTLLRPGLEGDPIPVPPKVTHESRLEALLEARGEIACYPHVWRPDRWDVKALYVDRWVWSDRDRAWYPIPPRVITVEQREDAEVTTVLFDGERARFRGEAPLTLRLLLRLCQLAHQAPGGRVEIAALAEGEEGLARIKPRLRQLKARHLGEAVALSDTHVTLRARVVFKAAAE
jgi:hypothetical protein